MPYPFLIMEAYKVDKDMSDKICMKDTDPHSLLENDDSELFHEFYTIDPVGVERTRVRRAHYLIVSDPAGKYGMFPSSVICGGYFTRQKERQIPLLSVNQSLDILLSPSHPKKIIRP